VFVNHNQKRSRPMRALLGLGSNVQPEYNMPRALSLLKTHPHLTVIAFSSLYTGPAHGTPRQRLAPPYWNAAVLVETKYTPVELKQVLRALEDQLGRSRQVGTMHLVVADLDLLLVDGDSLALSAADRAVVKAAALHEPYHLIPAAEIAPDWTDPISGTSLQDLAHRIPTVELEKQS
jgi:2-amino-4-hydroxy-6-hydroxymethyldihydropteridine diphosphokinase